MSLADQLEKLQNLLGAGLLSQEEFEAEKARLITERSASTTGGMGSASGEHARFSGEHASQLGAYRVLGLIGEGGMGSVYRARHTQSAVAERQGGEVVIKVMHAQYANREDFRARFEREADVGLRLDHPNLVNVHDLVMDGGQLALVMEYVEGRPLSKMIGQETGPIPWERAGPMFEQLLDGVAHAHAAGVVHRDLKPENIMVTGEGTLKVLDFGIAKSDDGGKTKTGTGLGTVDYMAPEQYLDAKRVDHRADIYALGMTLYEMLAGRLPWDLSTTEFEVLTRKSQADVPPPTDFYPSIPPHIVDAVMACLAVGLDERVPSIEALRDRLTAAPEPEPEPEPVPVPAPAPVAARQPPEAPAYTPKDMGFLAIMSRAPIRHKLFLASLPVVALILFVFLSEREGQTVQEGVTISSTLSGEAPAPVAPPTVERMPVTVNFSGFNPYTSIHVTCGRPAYRERGWFADGSAVVTDVPHADCRILFKGGPPASYSIRGGGTFQCRMLPEPLVEMGVTCEPAPAPTPPNEDPFAGDDPFADSPAPTRKANPSFDCRKAGTPDEHILCADAGLADQDREMSALYAGLKYSLPVGGNRTRLIQDQRDWLAQRRQCTSARCVGDKMSTRIGELKYNY